MAWIGAAITAGAGLVGNAMSQSSASSLNRDNRVWQTEMADTAMQRRVTDLKAAGLNPYLAVTGGGGAGGPAAMPAPMGQNPGQAWSQLGNQTASAVQSFQQGKLVESQVNMQAASADAAGAQAAKARADAAVTLAELPYTGATAEQQLYNLQATERQINQSVSKLVSDFELNLSNTTLANQRYREIEQDMSFQKELFPIQQELQKVDLERAKLGLPALENDAAMQGTVMGKALPYIRGAVEGAGIVGGAVGRFVGGFNSGSDQRIVVPKIGSKR